MRVLIIGSGGREHAIGKALYESPSAEALDLQLYHIGPYRNYGLHEINFLLHRKRNMEFTPDKMQYFAQFNLTPECKSDIVKQAQTWQIDLAIIGPEAGLAMGLVDSLEKVGIACVGPTKRLAEIETSKLAARHILEDLELGRYNPIYRDIYNTAELVSFIKNNQYVIKADGLAGGKGVHLPATQKDAEISVRQMMIDKIYGDAGNILVFQEKIIGPEVSVVTIVDGQNYHILPLSQDHKRVFDHDKGPNTGGMGSYTPTPFVSKKLFKKIESEIIQPTIMGMKQNNHPYNGFLYFGLMIVEGSPFVIEYNVRLGDPETQSQLPLIESDFVEILQSCIRGSLSSLSISHQAAVCVVLAAPGYPGKIETGQIVHNAETIQNSKSVLVFHAGTSNENGVIKVTSGRSLNVVGLGKNIKEAQTNVYKAIGKKNNGVYFDNMHYRKDIANYAI